jgi:hypothetical protein
MAENESLDLADSRRWMSAYHAIRHGKSCREVAGKVERSLCGALRAAFKEFAKKGVSLKDLLAARHDPHALHELVRKTRGHDYAQLFYETALAERSASDDAFMESYLWAIWDKMSDQISQNVVPCDTWPDFPDLNSHLYEVREEIAQEFHRIAENLANDPAWQPKRQGTRFGSPKVDKTVEMLNESLMGVPPK